MSKEIIDGGSVAGLLDCFYSWAGQLDTPVRFMEVCGTHTMAFFESGLREALPPNIELISGPGCPVCVTPVGYIDAACKLAADPDVIIASYGDMVRVPGTGGISLQAAKRQGARVDVLYSPLDAVGLAVQNPGKQVVFLAVGFETTAPVTACAVEMAAAKKINNLSFLVSHKLVTPALLEILESGNQLDGVLCPGHVSAIIGSDVYKPLAAHFKLPFVVTGFAITDLLLGLVMMVKQIVAGRCQVENAYPQAVQAGGNLRALELMRRCFAVSDSDWRCIGKIPGSGLFLVPEYRQFDARVRFGLTIESTDPHPLCRCGDVLRGNIRPMECQLFGGLCTPESPYGPCMVSSEGSCAAFYKYQ